MTKNDVVVNNAKNDTKNHAQNKASAVLSPAMRTLGFVLRSVARLSPKFAARLMAKLWFMPLVPKTEAHVLQWQSSAQQRIALAGRELFVFGTDPAAPLILCVHGWRGRGFQFRRFIEPLTAVGFRVAVFDAPAHGDGQRSTTLYEFTDTVLEIEKVAGPIDSIITHSFGSPAVAFAISGQFKPRKLAMIAGNFDIEYYLSSFCSHMGLSDALCDLVREQIIQIADQRIFAGAYQNIHIDSVSMEMQSIDTKFWYDPDDMEINIDSIYQFADKLGGKLVQQVVGVGHFDILKSPEIIQSVAEFIVADAD